MKRVDFDAAVAAYHERLVTVLRGFASGEDFLAHWVPDEDPVESVLSMLDAARIGGLPEIAVDLGKTSFDLAKLEREAARFGRVRIERSDAGVAVEVVLERDGSPTAGTVARPSARARPRRAAAVPPIPTPAAPRPALLAAGRAPAYEHDVPREEGRVRVEASDGGARLVLLVDPARHVVVAAGHGGAGEPSLSGCLDRVCALLEGQPIQDGADHAVLRVERATRGEGPAPVPGIVTPENAGEPFPHAQRLVRAALARYREASGYAATENRHRPGPSESWTGKDDAARMEAIRAVLPRICVAIGLDPTEVIAEEVLDRVRLRIGFAAGVPFAVRRRALDSIERALQAEVEPTLTVEIEARRDQSKLRRL